ncbi:efflux RND transporter permease subunit [Neolewinella lacunae]|uniref:Efflux RND transporter permease subunit n=1 Tax=Neolewinella lacunae TaxID=1517758 RepID=A0A923PQQ6_9BACT|nr:efflux RND transporter permease subunit [Neolewinella lacunae]MBC6995017.1 efflux RND transporter permease subunit [Neolewinella lacunae]MDN3633212.1 efflux RND transporter permease subunit [Neolewinella lacunae]
MINAFVRFFLENKLVVWLLLTLFVGWGLATAPFDFQLPGLPRDPVAVDAIPDIGENQQIVFTQWPGQSPQDVEDQITYPLTSALLGIPGVKSVRSSSMFGFSSIYLIFSEDVEFYWSRSRILEKLNSLPAGLLPDGATPTLGPDATALGQVYWYTLEGRGPAGQPVGGWGLEELRSIQDFYVRYGLSAAEGVSEVASIGGFVKEYQVDVDPEKMRVYGITLGQVMAAVKGANLDVGAATLEINLAEYFVRGLGYLQNLDDLELAVVSERNNVPIYLRDVARVTVGPAARRGILDKSGAEAVGGVVVARYGANPLEVINNVKEKIAELAPGLPKRTLEDGTVSQVQVVPFYDRSELIRETIGTLEEALTLEILITAIVVILLLFNLKSSLLVAGTLPVAVLMCFIAMRYFGVDANIVALSGIAIAIGTMVDMGIVLTESMIYRLNDPPEGEDRLESIYEATVEVGGAVLTAVATTIISFLPVFTMEAAEGKLFRPLAFTKTFALVAAIVVALAILPALAHSLFGWERNSKVRKLIGNGVLILAGVLAWVFVAWWLGLVAVLAGLLGVFHAVVGWNDTGAARETRGWTGLLTPAVNVVIALVLAWLLATYWLPLGVVNSSAKNFLFVVVVAGSLLGFFWLIIRFYATILGFLLRVKLLFLLLVGLVVFAGLQIYRSIGEEFMPALGEGAFLLMPTSMPHTGIEENQRNLRLLDMAVTSIPEVATVVGKAGRVESALDPAPLFMYENMILYKTEYATDENGRRLRFRVDEDGKFVGRSGSEYVAGQDPALVPLEDLIPDDRGQYYRQWRDHITSPDDIWDEVIAAAQLPGVTSAPKLQPIETRLVMLQTGMRAPMGIKVRGPDLETIETVGLALERELKNVEGVKASAVFADRIVGKPYLLLDLNRAAIARYGLSVTDVQQQIMATVGGMKMTTTVEGRERYAVRLRYPRELRDDPEAIKNILVPTRSGQIRLGELIDIRYAQGPQSIKSEDGFLVGYVLFDRHEEFSEVEVVNRATDYLNVQRERGALEIPTGVSYRFAGNYEQQVRANARLRLVVPIALGLIFLILYFQFKSITVSLMVFSGVFVAFSGGFLLLGGYANPDFMNFDFFGTNLRDLFQMRTINLSVAVWVGFLALFGIATDDGVLVATFLRDSFQRAQPETVAEIRSAVIEGGLRRVRPAMMTTATTILALLPVLTATGRGADIMLPMAIPSFGGMALQVVTMFTVPILWSLREEIKLKWSQKMRNDE